MKWRRRRTPHDGAEAKALAAATLAATKQRGVEVRRVADALRTFRQENHFGEKVELLIRGDN